MPHNKPTPNHLRPTLESLRLQNRFMELSQEKTVKVSGYWEQQPDGCRPEFSITLTGHEADIDEVIDTLKENGNLHDLWVETVSVEK